MINNQLFRQHFLYLDLTSIFGAMKNLLKKNGTRFHEVSLCKNEMKTIKGGNDANQVGNEEIMDG